jgi:Ca2+-transporting ATPase
MSEYVKSSVKKNESMNNLRMIPYLQQLIPVFLLAGLLFLSFVVLQEFLLTLVWALILAYVTWVPYQSLRRIVKLNDATTSMIMTLMITGVIFLIVLWLVALLQDELHNAYRNLNLYFAEDIIVVPAFIIRIPWLGAQLQDWVDQMISDPAGLNTQLRTWGQLWLGKLGIIIGGIGNYTIKLGVVLVTVFFCYRDGKQAVVQLHRGLIQFLGNSQHVYLKAAGDTVRAVVYGLMMAALVQGVLAGIGYAVAGVQAPILFGAVTAILALVPMGATLVWVPIALTLLLNNYYLAGTGLLLWGFLVVSTIDNLVRPLVISGASRVPFLVVLFGVLGGLSAFGVVGLFLGPMILAVLLAVWQAWLEQQTAL